MTRALPFLLCALAACEPREGPVAPEAEASSPVAAAPPPVAPPPVVPPPVAAAPVATSATAPAPVPSAAAIAPGPLRCGDQQCGPTQICIEAQLPPSARPNGATPASTFTCANDAMKGAGFKCDDPKDRRQRCVALTPGAAH